MVHLSETNLDTLLEIIRRQSNEIDDLKAQIKTLGQWQHDVVERSRGMMHEDACGCDACYDTRKAMELHKAHLAKGEGLTLEAGDLERVYTGYGPKPAD